MLKIYKTVLSEFLKTIKFYCYNVDQILIKRKRIRTIHINNT